MSLLVKNTVNAPEPMTAPLTKEQIRNFRKKINKCFEELRYHNILCRKNFNCSNSCGHYEISMGYDGDYIFYDGQMEDALRYGANNCFLQHCISDKNKVHVLEIVKRYGSDWDGNNQKSIMIPA